MGQDWPVSNRPVFYACRNQCELGVGVSGVRVHVLCSLLSMLVASAPMGAALSKRLCLHCLAVNRKRCAFVYTTFKGAALKYNFGWSSHTNSLIAQQVYVRL